jgi:hypothetical protein
VIQDEFDLRLAIHDRSFPCWFSLAGGASLPLWRRSIR